MIVSTAHGEGRQRVMRQRRPSFHGPLDECIHRKFGRYALRGSVGEGRPGPKTSPASAAQIPELNAHRCNRLRLMRRIRMTRSRGGWAEGGPAMHSPVRPAREVAVHPRHVTQMSVVRIFACPNPSCGAASPCADLGGIWSCRLGAQRRVSLSAPPQNPKYLQQVVTNRIEKRLNGTLALVAQLYSGRDRRQCNRSVAFVGQRTWTIPRPHLLGPNHKFVLRRVCGRCRRMRIMRHLQERRSRPIFWPVARRPA